MWWLFFSPLPFMGEGPGERVKGRKMSEAKILTNAKALRTHQTEAEQRLWYHLRAHRFMDLKFKRQKPMGRYIVDFVCVERQLIIELDGGQHAEQVKYDQHRDLWLRKQGYTILRFWNNEVMQQLEGVLEKIRLTLALSPDPSPINGRGEQSKDGTVFVSPLTLVGEGQGERVMKSEREK